MDPPGSVRDEIAAWLDRALRGRDDLRPVLAAGLHVTLAFLGWTDADRVAAVWDAASRAISEGSAAPLLVPAGLVAVPRNRPRLVALDLADEGGRATALQSAVAESLSAAGLHEAERRPFWPHMTLARLRRGARWQPLPAGPSTGPFDAVAVTLYRSHLSPSGARYEPLERCALA